MQAVQRRGHLKGGGLEYLSTYQMYPSAWLCGLGTKTSPLPSSEKTLTISTIASLDSPKYDSQKCLFLWDDPSPQLIHGSLCKRHIDRFSHFRIAHTQQTLGPCRNNYNSPHLMQNNT